MSALPLFPDSAAVEGGELRLGGLAASSLVDAHETPLVVYCEQTLRARAQAYQRLPTTLTSSTA